MDDLPIGTIAGVHLASPIAHPYGEARGFAARIGFFQERKGICGTTKVVP
jgi:hypothetical protein